MQGEQIRQLVHLSNHLIAQIDQIRILLGIQMRHQRLHHIRRGVLDELCRPRIGQVMQSQNGVIPRDLRTSVLANIDLHIAVNQLVEILQDLVDRDVTGIDLRLPVIELELIAQVQQKVYIGGGHPTGSV
jgi:hypothetical protein